LRSAAISSAGGGAPPESSAVNIAADLRSALDRVTRPPLLTAVAALMLALLLAVVGHHLSGLRPPSGGRIDAGTGDFLAFWTGAVAVHEGSGASLYDYDVQREIQQRTLGGPSAAFQGYLNPPILAIALSPLVPLGYVAAFGVFDVACVLSLAAGLAMLCAIATGIGRVRGGLVALVLVVASFQPMVETTFGGQNTAITFALLAGLAFAHCRKSTLGAALALGLLTYKPQYAAGAGIAFVIAGEWRVIAGAAAIAALHWVAASLWCGPAWPAAMLAFERAYRPLEQAANAHTHFSWTAVSSVLLPEPFAAVAALAGFAAVLAVWWRYRLLASLEPRVWFALVVLGTMLISPHQQYYDAALLALPAALLVDAGLRMQRPAGLGTRVALAAAYVGYPAWELDAFIQPLFFVLLALFVWAVRMAKSAGHVPA